MWNISTTCFEKHGPRMVKTQHMQCILTVLQLLHHATRRTTISLIRRVYMMETQHTALLHYCIIELLVPFTDRQKTVRTTGLCRTPQPRSRQQRSSGPWVRVVRGRRSLWSSRQRRKALSGCRCPMNRYASTLKSRKGV